MRTPGGWFNELEKNDTHWRPARGKPIPIDTMDDDYILNIYFKLVKEMKKLPQKSKLGIVIPDMILERIEKQKYEYPELFL